jgi:hypothetical protein
MSLRPVALPHAVKPAFNAAQACHIRKLVAPPDATRQVDGRQYPGVMDGSRL